MTAAPPPPYPYSGWDQRPASRSPWQMGCDLYEAYGRFLDRLREDKFDEGDGGWCERSCAERKSVGGTSCGELLDESSSYDADFGYTEDEQCERHRLKELEKLKRAPDVDAKAISANACLKSLRTAQENYRKKLLERLQKGPATRNDLLEDLGEPPTSSLRMLLVNYRIAGIVRKECPPSGSKWNNRYSLIEPTP